MTKVLEELKSDVYLVRSVYSANECRQLIERAEGIGFAPASVLTKSGYKMMTHVRNNERVNVEDQELAEEMWNRVSGLLPKMDQQVPVAVDSRLRFYRYDVGQEFRRHKDGSVTREDGLKSKLTYLVYLNDDFEGGETSFVEYRGCGETREKLVLPVKPTQGAVLLFRHECWHQGSPLLSGRKYVLRSDIFYDVSLN